MHSRCLYQYSNCLFSHITLWLGGIIIAMLIGFTLPVFAEPDLLLPDDEIIDPTATIPDLPEELPDPAVPDPLKSKTTEPAKKKEVKSANTPTTEKKDKVAPSAKKEKTTPADKKEKTTKSKSKKDKGDTKDKKGEDKDNAEAKKDGKKKEEKSDKKAKPAKPKMFRWHGSLMFSKEDIHLLNEAIRAYEFGGSIESFSAPKSKKEKSKALLPLLPKIRYPDYAPSFFLSSIMYLGKDRWIIWVNGRKMSNSQYITDTETIPSLDIVSVTKDEAIFKWETKFMNYIAPSWRKRFTVKDKGFYTTTKVPNIKISADAKFVTFALSPHQTFETRSMAVSEGKKGDTLLKKGDDDKDSSSSSKKSKKSSGSAEDQLNNAFDVFRSLLDN